MKTFFAPKSFRRRATPEDNQGHDSTHPSKASVVSLTPPSANEGIHGDTPLPGWQNANLPDQQRQPQCPQFQQGQNQGQTPTMEMMWQFMMQQQQQQNALMHQQQQQILLMQRLLGNNTNDDSSSDECVDSDSSSDIGYETDLTEVNTDRDVDEDDGGKDHDISDFAEFFSDYEHSSNYPTRFPSSQVVPLPRVTDNGVNEATMETTETTETTMANDIEPIPASTTPILPANHSQPTNPPTTIDDKVDDLDDNLETGQKMKEIEGMGCWHLFHQSDLPKGMRPIPGRWTVTSLN
jgi:hypothetical protein